MFGSPMVHSVTRLSSTALTLDRLVRLETASASTLRVGFIDAQRLCRFVRPAGRKQQLKISPMSLHSHLQGTAVYAKSSCGTRFVATVEMQRIDEAEAAVVVHAVQDSQHLCHHELSFREIILSANV